MFAQFEQDGLHSTRVPARVSGPVGFAGDGLLEGVLEWPEGREVRGGVVLAHPHPLHGATMAQPVVYRCAQSCRAQGMVSLRFNFRGVGRSEGTYSGWDEYRDVMAAARYLEMQMAAVLPGSDLPLALVGYSFGSVMAVISLREVKPDALVLIGFPVASDLLQDDALERLRGFDKPLLVVVGEEDDFAPLDLLQGTLDGIPVPYRLEIIKGTGHFFEGRQREVAEAVASFLAGAFSG